MDTKKIIDHIVTWLKDYSDTAHTNGFIVGISGGIDSAVTSTLCAMTGKKTMAVSMPIHQKPDQLSRAHEQIDWLSKGFKQVVHTETDLSQAFDTFKQSIPADAAQHQLSMANTRARLRMITLYALGQANGLLVAGTGNKIEDFGVGFYTKYGDGGVDISPIADLTKTQVFEIAKALNVPQSIQLAKPTDGLWEVERSDEDQLGATYPELEWALDFVTKHHQPKTGKLAMGQMDTSHLSPRQTEVLQIYIKFHNANRHKMDPIPVCLIPKEYFS